MRRLALLLLLPGLLAAAKARAPQRLGRVLGGSAALTRQGGGSRLKPGAALSQGDSLICGPGGTAGILLRDSSRLRLFPACQVKLNAEELEDGGAITLQLFAGIIQASISTRGGLFSVDMPYAQAASPGALCQISCDGQRVEIRVLEGRVELNAGGKRVEIWAGEKAVSFLKGPGMPQAMGPGELDSLRSAFKDRAFSSAP